MKHTALLPLFSYLADRSGDYEWTESELRHIRSLCQEHEQSTHEALSKSHAELLAALKSTPENIEPKLSEIAAINAKAIFERSPITERQIAGLIREAVNESLAAIANAQPVVKMLREGRV